MSYQNHSLNTKIFCELLKPFLLRIGDSFYGNPTRNKKVRGKNTLPQYHKTRFDAKLVFFKKTPLLMLTSQNKALFIVLTNQNNVLCIKLM